MQAIELRQCIDLAAPALFLLLRLRLGIWSSGWIPSMTTIRATHRLIVLNIVTRDTNDTKPIEDRDSDSFSAIFMFFVSFVTYHPRVIAVGILS
jgi:hypothetical protein